MHRERKELCIAREGSIHSKLKEPCIAESDSCIAGNISCITRLGVMHHQRKIIHHEKTTSREEWTTTARELSTYHISLFHTFITISLVKIIFQIWHKSFICFTSNPIKLTSNVQIEKLSVNTVKDIISYFNWIFMLTSFVFVSVESIRKDEFSKQTIGADGTKKDATQRGTCSKWL